MSVKRSIKLLFSEYTLQLFFGQAKISQSYWIFFFIYLFLLIDIVPYVIERPIIWVGKCILPTRVAKLDEKLDEQTWFT